MIRAIVLVIAVMLFISTPVDALSRSSYYTSQRIDTYDPFGTPDSGICFGGSTEVSQNIPADWREIFVAAATKFKVQPNYLAALYLTENGNVWHPIDRTSWPTSPAGASGPMQFMPGTWAGYKTDGDNDGVSDINNPWDAVFAAANLSSVLGVTTTTPIGTLSAPLKKPSLLRAAAAYNWGIGNVTNAGENAVLSALPGETENYVKNIYTLFESDFTKTGHPNYKDPVPEGTTSSGSPAGCTTGGIGSADGITFPLMTTQSAVIGNKPYAWCYKATSNCHHSYNAADIMMPTGTTVIAATGGVVRSAKDAAQYPSSVGSRAIIVGDDGNVWYYAHMGRNTMQIRDGQVIQPGDIIGKIGTKADAQGTDPHLHIDALPPPYKTRMGCSYTACASYPFIDIQPSLVKAFNTLP